MWLINHLKYVFNATFESMLIKSPNKGRFYTLFFLLFETLSSVIALGVSWFFIKMKYPNMDIQSMFFAGNNTLLLNMVNTISIVALVFLVNLIGFFTSFKKHQKLFLQPLGYCSNNLNDNSYYF